MSPTVTPNLYQLSGHVLGQPIHVDFTTSGFNGKPQFAYQDANGARSFSGGEIRVIPCDIGQLVSVTLRSTVDVGSTSFSLLVPNVQLPAEPHPSAHIDTEGVTTVHRFNVVPQLNIGQDDIYSVVSLHGTARVMA